MPSVKHEMAHLTFASKLIEKVVRMRMPVEEFCPVGAGRPKLFQRRLSFKPYSLQPNDTDWPTIFIESAISDADLWLRNLEVK
jgi:hypothetical protein